MGPAPALAAVRSAVRAVLGALEPGALALVACSGGPDSLALAAATAFEAPRAGMRAGAVTVDHRLQDGSDLRARSVATTLRELGLDPVEIVAVDGAGPAGGGGLEASARQARYAALEAVALRRGAAAVLLGHTRDDQAETVLLGLARGSGGRSLSGMAARIGAYRRPFLALDRATTRSACAAAGLRVWDDPHNRDERLSRARVRHRVLPVLEAELGPGVARALARSADLLRDDADALDAWAERVADDCLARDSSGPALEVTDLTREPAAIRRRVLRRAALSAGCPGTELFAVHVYELEGLIVRWRGQAWIDLPGRVRAYRAGDRITFAGPGAAVTPADHGEGVPGRG